MLVGDAGLQLTLAGFVTDVGDRFEEIAAELHQHPKPVCVTSKLSSGLLITLDFVPMP